MTRIAIRAEKPPLARAAQLLLRLGQGPTPLPEAHALAGSPAAWAGTWEAALRPALLPCVVPDAGAALQRGFTLDLQRLPDLAETGPPDRARRAVATAAALLLGPTPGERGELEGLLAYGLPLEELPGGWRLRPPWRRPGAQALASYLDEGLLEHRDVWRLVEGWAPEHARLAEEAIRIRETSKARGLTDAERDRLRRIRAAFGL